MFHGRDAHDSVVLGRVATGESSVIHVTLPNLTGPTGIPAALTGRLLRAESGQWVQTGDVFTAGTHTIPLAESGAWRIEVRSTGAQSRRQRSPT